MSNLLDLSSRGWRHIRNDDVAAALSEVGAASSKILDTIDVSYNKLSVIDLLRLPSNLKSVCASHNRITDLFTALPMNVWCDGNHSNDDDDDGGCRAVTSLDVSFNSIRHIAALPRSPSSLPSYHSLESLDLSNNDITSIDVDLSVVVPNLRTLVLDGNCLVRLPRAWPSGLEVLSVKSNELTTWQDVRFLAVAADTLTYLSLEDNPLHSRVAFSVAPFLVWLLPKLEVLDGRDLTDGGEASAATDVAIACQHLFRDVHGVLDDALVGLLDEGREPELETYLTERIASARTMLLMKPKLARIPTQPSGVTPGAADVTTTDSGDVAAAVVPDDVAVELEIVNEKIRKLKDAVYRLYRADMQRRTAAVVTIQRYFRGYRERRRAGDVSASLTVPHHALVRFYNRYCAQCAVRVQKVWRGHRARVGYRKLLEAWAPYRRAFELRAAIPLQRIGRGLLQRRRLGNVNVVMQVRQLSRELRGLQNMVLRLVTSQQRLGGASARDPHHDVNVGAEVRRGRNTSSVEDSPYSVEC
eukprot:PhM_4_TR10600/c0_g1_i1/m.101399